MNEKPISVVLDDLKMEIASLINNSNLQPFLVEPILKDLYLEAQAAAKKQLEIDRMSYLEQQNNNHEEAAVE